MAVTRKYIRLPKYDYSTFAFYFVTICTHEKRCILSTVDNDNIITTPIGKIVEQQLLNLEHTFIDTHIDYYRIMPNHIHVILQNSTIVLNEVIRQFKARSAIVCKKVYDQKLWQKGFHEHVIRNEASLEKIRTYIENNPRKWHLDKYHPQHI